MCAVASLTVAVSKDGKICGTIKNGPEALPAPAITEMMKVYILFFEQKMLFYLRKNPIRIPSKDALKKHFCSFLVIFFCFYLLVLVIFVFCFFGR